MGEALRTRAVRLRDPGVLAEPDAYAPLRHAVWQERWDAALEAYAAANVAGGTPTAADRLLVEIARIRLAEDDAAPRLEAALIREANGEDPVRRFLVSPLRAAGRTGALVAVLEPLLEACPALVDMRRLLVSLLARGGRLNEAVEHMDLAAAAAPEDLSVQAGRIHLRLLSGDTEGAAKIALELSNRLTPASREGHTLMQGLIRGGRPKEAAEVASKVYVGRFPDRHVAATAAQALLAAGLAREAIAAGEAAIAAGHDTGALRATLGEAVLRTGRPRDVATRALEHLGAGVALTPDHIRTNALYGEALLRAGRHEEAVGFLEKATSREIKSTKTRSLYARALRYNGRYGDAADQYLKVLEQAPDRWAAHRQAAGVLNQAGRHEEASKVFKAMVAKRAEALAPTFEEALAELPAKLESVSVPRARLDWAWELRGDRDPADREDWERRARWGLLSDLLIVDWLECREQQAEEAMALIADLDEADRFLEPLRGRGVVIATAHVGPMFSGPILLELCGLPSRWVASTPSLADAHYAASVISTSHQTDSQVARACFKALQAGYAVAIAVDGSSKMGSPTVRFEGQDINYSPFASHLAHKFQAPSFFFAPRWEDGRLAYTLAMLPSPEADEDVRGYAGRWRDAVLAQVREHLRGLPENLRLAGGLWSGVRPALQP